MVAVKSVRVLAPKTSSMACAFTCERLPSHFRSQNAMEMLAPMRSSPAPKRRARTVDSFEGGALVEGGSLVEGGAVSEGGGGFTDGWFGGITGTRIIRISATAAVATARDIAVQKSGR